VPRPPPGSSLPSRTVEPAPETGCVRDRFARIWRRRARRRIGSLRSLSWSVPSPALLLRRGGTVRIRANLACDPRCEDAIEKPVVCRSCCAEPERGAPVGRPRGSTARRGGRPRRGGCGPLRATTPRVCSNAARSAEPAERYQGQVAAGSPLPIHRLGCDAGADRASGGRLRLDGWGRLGCAEQTPARDDTRARRLGACRRPATAGEASANRQPRSNVLLIVLSVAQRTPPHRDVHPGMRACQTMTGRRGPPPRNRAARYRRLAGGATVGLNQQPAPRRARRRPDRLADEFGSGGPVRADRGRGLDTAPRSCGRGRGRRSPRQAALTRPPASQAATNAGSEISHSHHLSGGST
jgi:hypothetical protein